MSNSASFLSIPKKILLPVDFSASTQAALEMAAHLAEHFQSEIHLVHVIPMFPTTSLPDLVPEAEFIGEARKFAEDHLTRCSAALTTRAVTSTYTIEVGSDVVGNIMEVIEREHVDMIVISTHGMSGWHPLVFGSIAEKIVKLVHCPLMLLRSPKPDTGTAANAGQSKEWW